MEIDEILKGIKIKVNEAKKLKGFNGKHPAFRNWHAGVMQLLRNLPSSYLSRVNEFKALTFEDTGYKRGRKFFSSSDNSRFLKDLDTSSEILEEIIKTGTPKDKGKDT